MKSRETQLLGKFLKANPNISDPTTLKPIPEHRKYLENRLVAAFYAGVEAGDRLVELGIYESHPDGRGRRQFYRRKEANNEA